MTKLPNIDSIFYPNCVTKSQSEGLAEGSIHPYSGRKPVHLLRIISCSKACKVPGSYILLYNTWICLLFQYVKRWSDALRHLSKQYVFRSFRWIRRLFCIKVFSSFSRKQHLVYLFGRSNPWGLFFRLQLFRYSYISFLFYFFIFV